MKKLSLLTVCLFICFVSQAQSDSTKLEKKQKSFIASIRTLDNERIKGRLYAINDSQLVLAKSVKKLSNLLPANEQQYIPAENIKSFSLIRKNSVLKGALIGAGVGTVSGVAIGFASGDDPVDTYNGPVYDPYSALLIGLTNALTIALAQTAGEKAAFVGTALGTGGAIAGTIIGALSKKKFIIDGNKERFRKLQPEISMKLIRK